MFQITKKVGALFTMMALVCIMMVPVYASEKEIDSSGNVTSSSSKAQNTEKDFIWAGQSLSGDGIQVGYDVLMAGQNMYLRDGEVKGSVRAAGQTIDLQNMNIGKNISIAGMNLNIKDCNFDTAYLAGANAYVSGTSQCLHIFAENVTIAGTVNGDVEVCAEEVMIEEGAVISGTLSGEVGSEPQIVEGASVGTVKMKVKKESEKEEREEKSSNKLFGFIKIYSIFTAMVLWLFLRIFLRKPIEKAGEMVCAMPGKMAGFGALIMCALPVASILFAISVIGIPVCVIIIMLYIIACLIAVPFAGSAAGQAIFRKKVPGMNAWFSTAIGTLVLVLLCMIPYVKFFVKIAALIFTFGYIFLSFFKGQEKKGSEVMMIEENPME